MFLTRKTASRSYKILTNIIFIWLNWTGHYLYVLWANFNGTLHNYVTLVFPWVLHMLIANCSRIINDGGIATEVMGSTWIFTKVSKKDVNNMKTVPYSYSFSLIQTQEYHSSTKLMFHLWCSSSTLLQSLDSISFRDQAPLPGRCQEFR